MAESAVSFLIEYLGPLLVQEVKLLKGVRGEALRIRDELESMRCFLRDADAREDSDESIKNWVRQVREAAYNTEDILDEFVVQIGQSQHDAGGVFGALLRLIHSIKTLKARRRIAKEIQDMRIQLSNISRIKDYYNLSRTEQGSSCLFSSNNGAFDPRQASLFAEESELMGIDKPRNQLIRWLLRGAKRLSTISVVGMGGLGKTTLVKKVYDSEQVKKHFETRAWITVSQTFNNKDLLQNMISQFYEANQGKAPSAIDAMTDIQLVKEVRDYLQSKRFAVVLDDVWGVDAWKFLSISLPAGENGSRVILTTRRADVAAFCRAQTSDHIYNMQPLDQKTAWSLFCRRAFPLNENHCPPELEELSQSFVKKCRGLPLAIVMLGSLLATKDQSYVTWELLQRGLGSELENDDHLKGMTKILWLSFNDLPYHIKSCFLYLSVFPEDFGIGHARITSLWIAEGFVQRKQDQTPEEVSESYLDTLVARNLIQVRKRDMYGKVTVCSIHDLVREIILSKSKEENLFVSSKEENIVLSDKIRRLSIHNEGKIIPKCESSSRLRSLLIFGGVGISSTFFTSSFAALHLLRVLSIENVPMDSFPEGVTGLLHLRYLRLQNANLKHLPCSIGKLINLKTLSLAGNFICELPSEILKLKLLRHIVVYRYQEETDLAFQSINGVKVPSGLGSLVSLQSLSKIEAESCIVRELRKLTQLRKLKVIKLRKEDGHDLCTSVGKMTRLQILEIASIAEDEEIDFHSVSYPPPTLQRLALSGKLQKLPQWIPSLQNLRVLRLFWSKLEDDPLKALGSLSNLVELILKDAYDGEELCVGDGGYPKLKLLHLKELRGLKYVRVEQGVMPNLEILLTRQCEALVEVPFWLQHLTNLKELQLRDMQTVFLQSLQRDGEEKSIDFIRHIELIRCYETETKKVRRLK